MGIPESHGCLRAPTNQPSCRSLEDERGAKLKVVPVDSTGQHLKDELLAAPTCNEDVLIRNRRGNAFEFREFATGQWQCFLIRWGLESHRREPVEGWNGDHKVPVK
jgi:hypothetical protein